jgi:hypothetical protein
MAAAESSNPRYGVKSGSWISLFMAGFFHPMKGENYAYL